MKLLLLLFCFFMLACGQNQDEKSDGYNISENSRVVLDSAETIEQKEFWNATAMLLIQNEKQEFEKLFVDSISTWDRRNGDKNGAQWVSPQVFSKNYNQIFDSTFLSSLSKMDYSDVYIHWWSVTKFYSFTVEKISSGLSGSELATLITLDFTRHKNSYRFIGVTAERK